MKMVQGGEINILRVKDLNKGFKGNIEVYLPRYSYYCKSKVHVVRFESVYEYLVYTLPILVL